MDKRVYGTGTWTRTSPEKVRLCISAGRGIGGGRQRYYKTVYAKTDSAAERALRAFAAEVDGRTGERMTLAAAIDDYMQIHVSGLAPQTQRWYADTLARTRAALGHYQLTALTPGQVQKYYALLGDAKSPQIGGLRCGLAPRTVGHHHRALCAVLNWTYRQGYMEHKLADRITPPAAPPRSARALDDAERAAFLAALDAERLTWRCFGRMALTMGLRRGELCGLLWDDMQGDVLHVCHNLQELPGSRLVLGALKTAASERWLTMPPTLAAMLRELRKEQLAHAMQYALPRPEYVYSSINSTPYSPKYTSRKLAAIYARAGIQGATLHTLRHTCATYLMQQGISPADVAAYMGHSSTKMTLDVYGHGQQTQAARCSDAAAALLDV